MSARVPRVDPQRVLQTTADPEVLAGAVAQLASHMIAEHGIVLAAEFIRGEGTNPLCVEMARWLGNEVAEWAEKQLALTREFDRLSFAGAVDPESLDSSAPATSNAKPGEAFS